jgi:hypothetical protein
MFWKKLLPQTSEQKRKADALKLCHITKSSELIPIGMSLNGCPSDMQLNVELLSLQQK